jgi:hypothetical protein
MFLKYFIEEGLTNILIVRSTLPLIPSMLNVESVESNQKQITTSQEYLHGI